jgi:hypothetical protein
VALPEGEIVELGENDAGPAADLENIGQGDQRQV